MSYPRHLKLLCRPDHLFPYFIFPLQDYTKKFSVVCAGCKKSITPKKGETKASRLRAMEKDYHLECFKCSDCSLVLKPGVKGKECWPIKEQLFCYKCYIRRPTAHRS